MKLPQTTVLGLALLAFGLALCGMGLFLLVQPRQYEATTRIQVLKEIMDINSLEKYPDALLISPKFDSSFLQKTFKIIQSDGDLGEVVTNLNLNEVWGKKFNGGTALKTGASIARLRRGLYCTTVRNTTLITISFTSDDPEEAVHIVNAIAEAYEGYRKREEQQFEYDVVQVMEKQYDEEEQQIVALHAKVDAMRKELGITNLNNAHSIPLTEDQLPELNRRLDYCEQAYASIARQQADLAAYINRGLRAALPPTIHNEPLQALLDSLDESKTQLQILKNREGSATNALAVREQSEVDRLSQEFDSQVAGLLSDLGRQMYVTKAALVEIPKEIDEVKQQELEDTTHGQPYCTVKHQLESMLLKHRIFFGKLDTARVNAKIPKNSPVQIVAPAKQPESPLPKDFGAGAALIFVGLFPAVGGWLLLRASKRGI